MRCRGDVFGTRLARSSILHNYEELTVELQIDSGARATGLSLVRRLERKRRWGRKASRFQSCQTSFAPFKFVTAEPLPESREAGGMETIRVLPFGLGRRALRPTCGMSNITVSFIWPRNEMTGIFKTHEKPRARVSERLPSIEKRWVILDWICISNASPEDSHYTGANVKRAARGRKYMPEIL